jgi:hypothetical protein
VVGIFNVSAVGIVATFAEYEEEKQMRQMLSKELDMEMISELDTNGDGVDRFEFVIGVLCQLG